VNTRQIHLPDRRHHKALTRGCGATPWITSMLAAATWSVSGQVTDEYLERSLPVIPPQTDPLAALPYTIRAGDFRLLLSPSLSIEWNDNVNTTDRNEEDDFILRPLLNVDASYPITRNNLLRVNVGIGYDQYLDNSHLSTWRLQTGSGLEFDIETGDFLINVHDRVAYVRDSARRGDVAGTSEQGNFQNIAGLSITWNLGDLFLTLGYDHQDVISTVDRDEYQDRTTELVDARVGLRIRPNLVVGAHSPLSFTAYDLPILNDNTGYGGGVYAEWQPSSAMSVQPSFGYTVYDFDQTSALIPAEDQKTWYANLTLRHRPRAAIGYAISAGRELRLGVQSDAVEAWYVRPSISWSATDRISVQSAFFYENGTQATSPYVGQSEESYEWYGGSLTLAGSLTEKLTVSLTYRLTMRSSDLSARDYTQIMVTLQLRYLMQ
jgi:hypothetical protein